MPVSFARRRMCAWISSDCTGDPPALQSLNRHNILDKDTAPESADLGRGTRLPGEFTVTATAAGLSVASGGLKARVSHGSACKLPVFLFGTPLVCRWPNKRGHRSPANSEDAYPIIAYQATSLRRPLPLCGCQGPCMHCVTL